MAVAFDLNYIILYLCPTRWYNKNISGSISWNSLKEQDLLVIDYSIITAQL